MREYQKNHNHPHGHSHTEHCGCGSDCDHRSEHHHGEDESCGCKGHHHEHPHGEGESCGCKGHDHEHPHGESENCGCKGHHHEHPHGEGESCGCKGHDHEHPHEHSHEENEKSVYDSRKKEVYILENLGCANCAAKMERKIKELPNVQFANLVFATKQLQIVTDTDEDMLPKLTEICTSIEADVIVKKRNEGGAKAKVQEKNPSGKLRENKKDIAEISIGAVCLLAAKLLEEVYKPAAVALYVIGYFVLGREVLATAGKNLIKGRVFDENFLMSIATLGALAVGVYADMTRGAAGGHVEGYAEAVGVMLFYRVGELFEQIAVARSRSRIMEAVDLRPEVVTLVNGSETITIPAEEAKVGDVLVVRPGDRIPLDGQVIKGKSQIDTSPVTGEPVPVEAKSGTEVISGCMNLSGVIEMKVEKVMEDSMVTRILESVENAAAGKPKIDRFITRFSRVYTPIVVALAFATAVIPSLLTGNWEYWIYTALTFLVISCPCALVLSVPLAFFSGIGAGSKQGILFKGGSSIEALASVKAVVMDKTGTVTEGNFVVQSLVPENGTDAETLLKIAGACEKNSTHPIAQSIMKELEQRKIEAAETEQTTEISGKGVNAEVFISGEKKTVLCGNRKLLEEHKICVPTEDVAYGTEVFVACDGIYAGRIMIADRVKKDTPSAVSELKKYGVMTAMLTGDTKENAEAVAKKAGIDEVYAQLLPEEKVSNLRLIRNRKGSVMFVGDGINDAPVLAGADVGAAMGSGADAAIEAADVVFMTSAMGAVPKSMRIAKDTAAIAKQNVVFALVVKALIMALGLVGGANMWMAVFADTGVSVLCILNSVRILHNRKYNEK